MPSIPDEVRTDRLRLTCWQPHDATELRELLDRCDGHLRPWIPFMRDEPRSLAGTRAQLEQIAASFAAGEHFRFAIRELAGGALIGETMLIRRGAPGTIEAGYWLDERRCGHGFATEATAALLPLAFDTLGVTGVTLRCDERNTASVRVAERLGGRQIDTEQLEENGESVRLRVFLVSPPR